MIAAGILRAGRFNEMSLPILWAIAEEKAKNVDPMHQRAGTHARRAIFGIYRAAKDREALRRRLEEMGEKALAAQLDEWSRK